MKPFLCIDITEDKNNDKINGTQFVVASTSQNQNEALEKAAENAVGLAQKTLLPLPVRIVHWISGAAGAVSAYAFANSWIENYEFNFVDAYNDMSLIFLIAVAGIGLWGALTYISHKKSKNVMESDEGTLITSRLDSMVQRCYEELGVPASAPTVDILSFNYKVKDEKISPKASALSPTPFDNSVYRIFSDGEAFYIADVNTKYALPITGAKAIRTVKKRIGLSDWNKDTPFNKGEYKQYKITENEGVYSIKNYHILELESNGETWGIYFPNYELPVFEKATGLKAE